MFSLLQDHTEKPSSLLVLVGGSLGVATVLILICLAIAIYHKRSQQLDCPLETPNRTQGVYVFSLNHVIELLWINVSCLAFCLEVVLKKSVKMV